MFAAWRALETRRQSSFLYSMCVYSEDVLKCERGPRVHESPKGSMDSNVPALCSRCSDGWITVTRCSNPD